LEDLEARKWSKSVFVLAGLDAENICTVVFPAPETQMIFAHLVLPSSVGISHSTKAMVVPKLPQLFGHSGHSVLFLLASVDPQSLALMQTRHDAGAWVAFVTL